jgi:hypothetical protein
LTSKQASYHPIYVNWPELLPKVYPESEAARQKYIHDKLPMVVGPVAQPTHVRVAVLFWGGLYEIYVPRNTHPTEFVECDGSGPCRRRPLQ